VHLLSVPTLAQESAPGANGATFDQLMSFIGNVGGEVADVVQVISSNRIGAFFLGLFVIVSLFRLVLSRIKRG
jgi:hypothetical protein